MAPTTSDQFGNPNPVKVNRAVLSYKKAEKDAWTRLDDGPVKNGFNIQRLNFNYGIAFEQASAQGKGACRITYEAAHLGQGVSIENISQSDLEVTIPLVKSTTCSFDGVDAVAAASFPLAKVSSSWNFVKLRLAISDVQKFKKREELRVPIMHHLTGKISMVMDNTSGKWLEETSRVLQLEAQAQGATVTTLSNCRISTVAYGNRLVIAVWPNRESSEEERQAVAPSSHATRYTIGDSQVFPSELAGAFRAEGQEFAAWEFQVIKNLPGLGEAPIIGVLLNKFKQEADKLRFKNRQEENVTIMPVIGDVLGEAQRLAVNSMRDDLDEISRETLGFLSGELKIGLPVQPLFLTFLKYEEKHNNTGVQRPAGHRPDSPLYGVLPATGKSSTLAALNLELLTNPEERVLNVMTRNVAVDALLGRCVEAASDVAADKNLIHPFVRLYSASTIAVQHLENDPALRNPYHIDNKRVAMAERVRNEIFLKGRKKLLDAGYIAEKKEMDQYKKALRAIDRAVMSENRAVFCTSSMCRSPALVWTEKVGDEVLTRTWDPTTAIFDELACSNPPELLIPVVTFAKSLRRFVGAGDHYQLKGLVFMDEAKRLWAKSLFQRGCEIYPMTLLDVNYRQHSGLAQAPLDIIYSKEQVKAHFQTSRPRNFLKGYMRLMPLEFRDQDTAFQLQSFVHFVNVTRGREVLSATKSKSNMAEIDVCVAIISTLFLKGLKIKDTAKAKTLGVMTGCAAQVAALEARFKQESQKSNSQWSEVHVVTADSVQGGEFDICLVSLVSTTGSRGFVGEMERGNVLATRPREVMIYIGNWNFWHAFNDIQYVWMDRILYRYRDMYPDTFVLNGYPITTAASTPTRSTLTPTASSNPPPATTIITQQIPPHMRGATQAVTKPSPSVQSQQNDRILQQYDEETEKQRRDIEARGEAEIEAIRKRIKEQLNAHATVRQNQREKIERQA